jgi:signal transduction histidine kinase
VSEELLSVAQQLMGFALEIQDAYATKYTPEELKSTLDEIADRVQEQLTILRRLGNPNTADA